MSNTDATRCTCVVEDDGDVESGPHLSIDYDERCVIHGREAKPDEWAEADKAWPAAGECVICGEMVIVGRDAAEMHNPGRPEEEGGVVHASCGTAKGWEVS